VIARWVILEENEMYSMTLSTEETVLLIDTYVEYCTKRPCGDIPELLVYAEAQNEAVTPNNVRFLVYDFIGTKINTDAALIRVDKELWSEFQRHRNRE